MNDLALKDWARQDLGRYKEALSEIQHFKEKIQMLEAKANRYTKPLDSNHVQVQGRDADLEKILVIIVDMKSKYNHMQLDAEKTCREIELRIGEIPDKTEQQVLRDHWCYGIEFWKIAGSLHYSERHIFRIHNEALISYANHWKDKTCQSMSC